MRNYLTSLFAGLALVASTTVVAEPEPLGFELGTATQAQVQENTPTALRENGVNKYSDGPTLVGNGAGLDIDGLKEVLFIFDDDRRLAAVLLTLSKHRFDAIRGYLDGKYERVSSRIPHVGNKEVVYRDGKATVEANAPHMSFEMTVLYAMDDFLDAYERIKKKERQAKQREEGSML